jgi:hypothetical protein
MRVVLSTIGRFQSFDLARQLHRHGVLEQIYTGYPRFKFKQERLTNNLIRSYPWIVTLFMELSRYEAMHGPRRVYKKRDSPIVATENSGGSDCIEDGTNGFVVSPRDVDALAKKSSGLPRTAKPPARCTARPR